MREISGGGKNAGERLSRVGGWRGAACGWMGDQGQPSDKLTFHQSLTGVRERALVHGGSRTRAGQYPR